MEEGISASNKLVAIMEKSTMLFESLIKLESEKSMLVMQKLKKDLAQEDKVIANVKQEKTPITVVDLSIESNE